MVDSTIVRESGSQISNEVMGRHGCRLVAWIIGLAIVSYLSAFHVPVSRDILIALHAAVATAYLAVLSHCIIRFTFTRSTTWMMYSMGVGLLALAGILQLAADICGRVNSYMVEPLELVGAAMIPIAGVLLMTGVHTVRARATGKMLVTPKSLFRALLITMAVVAGWKLGLVVTIDRLMYAAKLDPQVVTNALALPILYALIYRTLRISMQKDDELISPLSFWAGASFIASTMAVVHLTFGLVPGLHMSAASLAGALGLLAGLRFKSDSAHSMALEERDHAQTMQKVSWALVGATTVRSLTSSLARAILLGVGARHVAVYLPGAESHEMVLTAVAGIDDPKLVPGKVCSLKPDRRPGFHNGHTARAYASGEVQVVDILYSDVEFLPWRTVARQEGVVSSIPLKSQGRVIGVMNLFFADIQTVSESKLKMIETIAVAVAPAVSDILHREMSSSKDISAAA